MTEKEARELIKGLTEEQKQTLLSMLKGLTEKSPGC